MRIHGQNLFPLSVILPNIQTDKYFMSADGSVFSMARGKFVRLLGSNQYRGRTFTVPAASLTFQCRNGGTVTVRHIELKSRATCHPSFTSHVKEEITLNTLRADMNKMQAKPVVVVGESHHATSVEAGIKAKGSIIGRVHKGRLVFGSEPKIHMTADSVKRQMERLAMEHPGVKFVKFKIGQSVVAGGVTWE